MSSRPLAAKEQAAFALEGGHQVLVFSGQVRQLFQHPTDKRQQRPPAMQQLGPRCHALREDCANGQGADTQDTCSPFHRVAPFQGGVGKSHPQVQRDQQHARRRRPRGPARGSE